MLRIRSWWWPYPYTSYSSSTYPLTLSPRKYALHFGDLMGWGRGICGDIYGGLSTNAMQPTGANGKQQQHLSIRTSRSDTQMEGHRRVVNVYGSVLTFDSLFILFRHIFVMICRRFSANYSTKLLQCRLRTGVFKNNILAPITKWPSMNVLKCQRVIFLPLPRILVVNY